MALVPLARAMELWAYRRCDVLVCVSHALAGLAIQHSGLDPEKVIVVPNGVDARLFNPADHVPRRIFNGSTIGFVGNLRSFQRLDLLVGALDELRTEGIDFKLVVVGDGPMRQEWENLARALGKSEHVRFVGQVPWSDVPAYIAGFDIGYVGPIPLSIGEMYLSPLKLYEYAAMARPVVASGFKDARSLIVEGSTGYLFAAGDREDLKGALRRAYGQRQRWDEMGAQARRLVVGQHSWDARVRELASKVEPILEKKYGAHCPAGRRN